MLWFSAQFGFTEERLKQFLLFNCALFAAAVKFSEHDLKYKTDSKYNKDAADVTLCLQLQ